MQTCMTVDDSKVVRKFARKIIEDLGFVAREACDGQDALTECGKELPDCILLDWNMPIMDGLDFIKQFRSKPENAKVVIIFCTTVNDIAKIQEAIKAGANEYIMKPFDKDVVRDKFIQTGLIKS